MNSWEKDRDSAARRIRRVLDSIPADGFLDGFGKTARRGKPSAATRRKETKLGDHATPVV